jgi:transcriptional regulator with XRE-family HTH domain
MLESTIAKDDTVVKSLAIANTGAMDAEGLGAAVRRLRNDRGWTQTRLAAEVETTPAYISQIESGKPAVPNAGLRRRLATALGVRHIDLLVAAGELTDDEVPSTSRPASDEPPAGSVRAELCAAIMGLTEAEAVVLAPIVEPQLPIAREVAAARAARRRSSVGNG